jgi:superfamily II DNA/RNA helicase
MQSIPLLLEQRNVLVTAPTGSGKTISFGLPLIQNTKGKNGLQAVII